MKNVRSLPFIALMLCSASLLAQAPGSFSYQAVMRDALGHAITGHTCSGRYVLRAGVPLGAVVYEEQHTVTTNDQGLFTVQVGSGTPIGSASFSSISWRNGPYFLEVQIDLDNTGSFTTMGTQQLLSVPYALYAQSSNIPNGTEVGQIAHWDGNTWLVDSGLYVYQKRFGIGTLEPDAPLGIQADPSGKLFSVTGQPTPVGEASNDKYRLAIANQNTDSAALSLDEVTPDGDETRLSIQTTTGHIGIGTQDPVAPLAIVSRNVLKSFFQTGDKPRSSDFGILTDSTGFGIDQGIPGSMTSRFFIQGSTGFVGIGTSDPVSRMSVVADSITGAAITIHKCITSTTGVFNPAHWTILAKPASSSVPGFSIDDMTSGVGVSRLFIADSTGHVGVGTTNPGAPLSIKSRSDLYEEFKNGDIPNENDFRISSGGGTGLSFDQDTTGGIASRLYLQGGTGYIGIGTQDPPAPLAIVSRSVLKQFFQTGDFPTQSQFGFTQTDTTGFGIDQGIPGSMTSRLFIEQSTGMIGLGTTDPSSKLHIQESTPNGGTTVKIQNSATAANAGWAFGHVHEPGTPGDGDLVLYEDLWPEAGDQDFNDAALRFQHGGNVGINEPLPDTRLHVSRPETEPGAATSFQLGSGIATIGPVTGKNISLDYQGVQARGTSISGFDPITSSSLHLQRLGGNILIHGDDAVAAHHVTVTEDGKIGVGKEPIESLDVNGAITLGNSSSPAPAPGTIRWTGTDFEGRMGSGWESITSPWLVINTKLVYNPTVPKVGIGTEQPTASLHVSRALADPEAPIALAENTGIAVMGPITDNLAMDYRGLQARHGEFVGDVLSITATTLNLQRLGGEILIHGDATFSDDHRVIITSDGKLGLGKSPTERLDVNGAITLGDASSTTPPNGTIRWSGTDFEGRSSGEWVPFDAGWRRVISSNDVHHNARVGIGIAAPTSALHVVGQGSPTEGGSAATIGFIDSAINMIDDREFIGLRVYSTSTQSPGGTRKNIGLYVSDVAGQPSAENNIAAVLNGNAVIGDLVPASSVVGSGGSRVLAIQNGTAPSSAVSSSSGLPDGGVQLYSASGSDGVSSLHIMRGNGDVIKLYKAAAITPADASPLGPGVDPGTAELIENMRIRINELETILKNVGLLTP